jgi:peptidoglycan hydrolase-like protein with peptidoglycan-binding domain
MLFRHTHPVSTGTLAVAGVVFLLAAISVPAGATEEPAHEFGQMVDYPLVFPVGDGASAGSRSGFWDSRSDGTHHAQDIMAPKLTPLYAAADGTVTYVNWSHDPDGLNPERCCSLVITHDDGWQSWYLHLNNDTPGTDDGLAWGIASGIAPGVQVEAGQLIGYVGDSGNCDTMAGCPPHLHFELHDPTDVIVDAYQALRTSEGVVSPCSAAGSGPLSILLGGNELLRRGTFGPAVYELQGFLRLRGYQPGPADGTLTDLTHQAVRLFQQRQGLVTDGVVGAQTRSAIRAISERPGFASLAAATDEALLPGMRGPAVRELKRWLRVAGYDPGGTGNWYDAATVDAVRSFQAATPGLPATGEVDRATRLALAGALHLRWPGTCS